MLGSDQILRFPPTPTLSLTSSPTMPPQSSPVALPSPLPEMEAKHYYRGLPPSPPLVARSSTTPLEESTVKELRPVGNYAIKEIWEGSFSLKLFDILDSVKVQWTSIDLVRIGNIEETFAPVVVWIGVRPASLSGYDGLDVASKCKKLLLEHDIADVDVEIRESLCW